MKIIIPLKIVIVFILFLPLISTAQNAKVKKIEAEADEHFKYDRNYEALGLYLQIDSLRPNDPKIIARIGICYIYYIKSRALPYLERAKSLNYKEDYIDYYLARAYHLTHQFDKAAVLYKQSKSILKSKLVKQDIDLYLRNCNDGKELIKDPVQVKIKNLGSVINSQYSEYAPIISADESVLLFTSQRPVQTGKKKNEYYADDIFVSYKENGEWKQAENIGSPINTTGSDASVAFSMDGEEIFIYKSDSLNPSGGSIYISKKNGDKWGSPIKMNANINSGDGWEPSITISPDETFVFFTSNRPGGYGGTDIYISKFNKKYNEWGKAKNLGPLINTPYDEDAPFIHPDGKTLYFSSKGHPSLGGFDIYTTSYFVENDSITPPVNVGYPINTADDEIFFIWSADGTRGYFSSAREDTYGKTDIYMVTRENIDVNLILFSGNVKTVDNKSVAATLIITDNETNKIVGYYDSTKFKENFAISLVPGKNYGIAIEAKNYLTYSENLNIPVNGFHEIKKEVRLVALDQGGLIVLKNVLFEPGKAELKSGSSPELDRYYNLIKENPKLLVEIAGHAFDLEDHKSNLDLSEQRAEAVKKYLINKGANPENLKAVGYGDKFKVTENNSSNTRTEFIIREALAKTQKFEERQGYYNEHESKAVAEAKHEVNTSINTGLKEKYNYLVKKDQDIYFGTNNSKNLKEFKGNEEIKEKVEKGALQPVIIKGLVTDASSGKNLFSIVVITDANGKEISETKTSEDGQYSISLYNAKEKKYTITVHTYGYGYGTKDIVVPGNSTKKKELVNDFKLSSLEVGSNHIIRNIYFDFNTANIKKESFKELKKLETLLKKNKSIKVEISAHTDNKGDDEFNKILSQKRAESVVSYLSGKGISLDRIIAKGYGEERPMASNDDEEEGRELNRRIEFMVLEK